MEEALARLNDYEIALVVTDSAVKDISYLISCGIPLHKIRSLLHEKVVSEDKTFIPSKKFWGQNGEDVILALLFTEKNIAPSNVKYLEIGTNDPIFGNNSYYFYERGGRGVLVDPLPSAGIMANMVRPNDHFIQAAVTGESSSEKKVFYVDETVTAISSLHPAWMKESKAKGEHTVHEIEVRVIGINDLIQEIGFSPNLLLIDAEGEDENILYNLDFTVYHPLAIIVESISGELITYMRSKGYIWYANIQETNFVFLREM